MSTQVSRRRLPHIYPENTWVFVTWHLSGVFHDRLYPPPGKASAGKAFVWMDRYLDATVDGPMFLKRPEIADLVVDALRRGAVNRLYELAAFVVMSNHVHVLLRPIENLTRILQLLKGATARQANEVLGRTGESFWQRESYDHWVRNQDEFGRILAYIENNPMKAGLVAEAAQYRWSSAWIATAN